MSLRKKIRVGAVLMFCVPALIASITLGLLAQRSSDAALVELTEARLIAARDLTKDQIEDYFGEIRQHAAHLATTEEVIHGLSTFGPAYDQLVASSDSGRGGMEPMVASYYQAQFAREYRRRSGGDEAPIQQWLDRLSPGAAVLQRRFIVDNPHPLGEKHLWNGANDGSAYAAEHARVHPTFRDFVERFGFYDLFLVDRNGRVLYSVFKELDFATSLVNGPFASSGLGTAFQSVMALRPGGVAMTDFSAYGPSYGQQAGFVGSPVFVDGVLIGALILQMPLDHINQVMTHHAHWDTRGLGGTGETFLVGSDGKTRSLVRQLIEAPGAFVAALEAADAPAEVVSAVASRASNIGLLKVDHAAANAVLRGETGVFSVTDFRGVERISAVTPLSIEGLGWVILSEIDAAEAFAPIGKLNQQLLWSSVAVAALMVVLGLVVGAWFAGTVTGPIVALSDVLRRVAASSDLRLRAEAKGNDEVGQAASSLNCTLDRIQAGLLQVAGASEQTGAAAEQSAVFAEQSSRASQSQLEQAEQIAVAMQEMSTAVHEVAHNVAQASTAADEAEQCAQRGSVLVSDVRQSIEGLAEQVARAVDVIATLEQDSAAINTVLNVINEIAEQTNLLALNAAIEAARAGEYGRGFAVVADEVRGLAQRTQESTKEIDQVIQRLQGGARRAVDMIAENRAIATEVVGTTESVDESFSELTEAVVQINAMSTQIACATEEQAAVAEEINRGVVSINDVAAQTAEATGQAADAARSLKQLSASLSDLVGQFKLV